MKNQQVARLNAAKSFEVESSEVPEPGPGDVVICVAACGICGSDLTMFKTGTRMPGAILGHEFVGSIVAMGSEIDGLSLGQRVVANPTIGGLGLGQVPGAFAEYVLVPNAELGRTVFSVPDSLPDELGAMVEPFAVGLHAINNAAVTPQDRAVIFGAGTIGLCVLAALKARGVKEIIIADPSPRRRDLALSMGASAVFDPLAEDGVAFIAARFGKDTLGYGSNEPLARASVAFDCAGAPTVLELAMRSLMPKGRLVLVAVPKESTLPRAMLVMLRELAIIGANAYDGEFTEAIDLLAGGIVDLTPLVTHRFPLSQIAEAFAMQLDVDQAVKVLVTTD